MKYAAAYKGFILFHIRVKLEYFTMIEDHYFIFCVSKIFHLTEKRHRLTV